MSKKGTIITAFIAGVLTPILFDGCKKLYVDHVQKKQETVEENPRAMKMLDAVEKGKHRQED